MWDTMIEVSYVSDLITEEWFNLMEDSKQRAERDYLLLNEQISDIGWGVKNILLNSQEQARYSFVDD